MLDPRLNHAVAVARMASFTKAAALIGVTQSAITKSVADLEKQLGYSLFYRTAKGALTTNEGREFVQRAARLLEEARELLNAAAKKDPYADVLRIGVCPASLEWLLVEPLAALLRDHPDIRFEVVGGKFETIILQLRSGAVDVAIGFDAAFVDWKDVIRQPITPFEATMFVRKDHPLLALEQLTVSDLAKYPMVSPSDSRPYGETIRNIFENEDKDSAKYLHIVDFFPIARQIVKTSDAVGVVSEGFFGSAKMRSEFVSLSTLSLFHRQPMCCAIRSRWEPNPPVRAFIAALERAFPPAK
jgi:DNA-binding transcriptional LysR family regulator